MEEYIPPTWHNGYDNSHLIEEVNGIIHPKPVYQAYADQTNAELQKCGERYRLVWDEITSSFCQQFIEKKRQ